MYIMYKFSFSLKAKINRLHVHVHSRKCMNTSPVGISTNGNHRVTDHEEQLLNSCTQVLSWVLLNMQRNGIF